MSEMQSRFSVSYCIRFSITQGVTTIINFLTCKFLGRNDGGAGHTSSRWRPHRFGLLLNIAKGTTDPRFQFISQLSVLGIAYNLPASGGTGGTSTTAEAGRKFFRFHSYISQ